MVGVAATSRAPGGGLLMSHALWSVPALEVVTSFPLQARAPHHRNGGLIRLMEPGSEWVRIIAVLCSAGHKVSVWGAV